MPFCANILTCRCCIGESMRTFLTTKDSDVGVFKLRAPFGFAQGMLGARYSDRFDSFFASFAVNTLFFFRFEYRPLFGGRNWRAIRVRLRHRESAPARISSVHTASGQRTLALPDFCPTSPPCPQKTGTSLMVQQLHFLPILTNLFIISPLPTLETSLIAWSNDSKNQQVSTPFK